MKQIGIIGWTLLALIVLSIIFPSYLIRTYLQYSKNFNQPTINAKVVSYTPGAQTCNISNYQLVNGKKIYLSSPLTNREEREAGAIILTSNNGSTASMLLAPSTDESYSRETFDSFIESAKITPQSLSPFDPINIAISKYNQISYKNQVLSVSNSDVKYQIVGDQGYTIQTYGDETQILFSNFKTKEGWPILFSNSSDKQAIDCTIKAEMQ